MAFDITSSTDQLPQAILTETRGTSKNKVSDVAYTVARASDHIPTALYQHTQHGSDNS